MKKSISASVCILLIELGLCFGQSDANDGVKEIYNINNWRRDGKVYENLQDRDSWNIIRFVDRVGTTNDFILHYDRLDGSAIFMKCHTFEIVNEFNDWPETCQDIITIDVDGDGNDELLFYEPGTGEASIYSVDNNFNITCLNTFSGWGRYWKILISIDVNGDNKQELLRYSDYDTLTDISAYNTTSNEFRVIRSWDSWGTTWKLIRRVSIQDISQVHKGLIFYDPYNETIELQKVNPLSPTFFSHVCYDDAEKGWKEIVAGNFGSGIPEGDLFFYDQVQGLGKFYNITPYGLMFKSSSSNYRKTWSVIAAGGFYQNLFNNDNLLFYERLNNFELPIPTYDGTNEAVHPDILIGDDGKYKLVFTPYADSEDSLENPSVLESSDGYIFTDIIRTNGSIVVNPLVEPLGGNNYNNDPDILFDSGYYYLVYQETFGGSQNIVLQKYDTDWNLVTSATIITGITYNKFTLSPALMKRDNEYYMFYVALFRHSPSIDSLKIAFLKTTDIWDWDYNAPTYINLNTANPDTFFPWHIDVVKSGFSNDYFMLICGKFKRANFHLHQLFLAKSTNRVLTEWDLLSNDPIIHSDNYGYLRIYRSTGLFDEVTGLFTIWYSFFRSKEPGIGIKKGIDLNPNEFDISIGNTNNNDNGNLVLISAPNPFKRSILLSYNLNHNSTVEVCIYDVTGKKVREMINENQTAGMHRIHWDGMNQKGKRLAAGVYFCKITTDDTSQINKLILMR